MDYVERLKKYSIGRVKICKKSLDWWYFYQTPTLGIQTSDAYVHPKGSKDVGKKSEL